MRPALTLAAALMLCGLSAAAAQDMMRHVDLTSPDMVAAVMTRVQVEAVLAGATSDKPADFTGRKLSGLDLSGLDLSGAVLRAARLNKTRLVGARLDRVILDQAYDISPFPRWCAIVRSISRARRERRVKQLTSRVPRSSVFYDP